MSASRHEQLERRLRELGAPDEAGAHERGLEVIRAAHAGERRMPSRRPAALRAGLAAAIAALAAVLMLTPAGASVRDWIEEAVTVEEERIPPVRLPAEGSILTVNGDGAWVLAADGSRRRLGDYEQATFSPNALNVAAVSGNELLAVDPRGELQWSISKPGRPIADPAWAPSALRIAYRAGPQLRIVEGDGSPDRLVAARVAPVAPAWRPHVPGEPERDVLAYAEAGGGVRLLDAVEAGPGVAVDTEDTPRLLSWLDDGRLVVASDRAVEVFAADGERLARVAQPPARRSPTSRPSRAASGSRWSAAAAAPTGRARSSSCCGSSPASSEPARSSAARARSPGSPTRPTANGSRLAGRRPTRGSSSAPSSSRSSSSAPRRRPGSAPSSPLPAPPGRPGSPRSSSGSCRRTESRAQPAGAPPAGSRS